MISIVTPWLNHPELIADYERVVQGAEMIVVDTGSDRATGVALRNMLMRGSPDVDSVYSHNDAGPFSFAASCNLGLSLATGDTVMFLNNDIQAVPGWLDAVARDVKPGALYGPATGVKAIAGQPMMYIEGWCIAAHRDTWHELGGWDAETFQRPYWEDVDLSWRATQLGIRLLRRPWMVTHIGNTTSSTTPGAYDASEANKQAFERKVRAAMAVPA